ncbi:transcriptional regulator, ArsR family [Methylobacillus rhizosphaerae]|uniref:Transcriptional regulator, ArsR family n=1 Tax=Methylobacillus rhizosphaerae TaxID=551994 RepID=A0A238Z7W9_9PROT|nr:ArsR family transcriptional regulator [Methylobacillus rhizosphaerae]SNR79149.1 transcriptional regulator, ArsR family [Methylobacillus rhizosphaerae]
MKSCIQIPPEWQNISHLFVALGDAHRQRILLSFESGEQLNISQIVAGSELSRSAITHHLKVLEQGGALKSVKAGKEVLFSIDKTYMQTALESVLHYIQQEI